MFHSASLKHRIDKATFKKEEPKLREELLNAQFELAQQKKFPVLILIGGVELAGKGETANLLKEWLDPRTVVTTAYNEPSDSEAERPFMWRFWRTLPPKGRIGILLGAWHTQPIIDRVYHRLNKDELDLAIVRVKRFERELAADGALVLKFWLHVGKKWQRERMAQLAGDKDTAWRIGKVERDFAKRYDRFLKVSEHFVRNTSTGEAPWYVVSGEDEHYRALTVGRTLLAAMRERLDEKGPRTLPDRTPPLLPSIDKLNVLKALDLTQKTDKAEYEKQLEKYQGRLALLTRHKRFKDRSLLLAFEGNDAAGKGGAIRRVTQSLDARIYNVVPIAAPTEEERAQPWLWRFWRQIPRHGRATIFDRTWYGRVLVERVEGFADESDWMRAYGEINDFELQQVENGAVLVKFWLATSKEEQLKRFKAREQTAFKRFKITDDDWRNRKKWDAYESAVCDMVDRTSTEHAPWTLVEANDKYFARIKVLKTVVTALEKALER